MCSTGRGHLAAVEPKVVVLETVLDPHPVSLTITNDPQGGVLMPN